MIDPYVEDPEPHCKWVVDTTLKDVCVEARTNKVRDKRAIKAAEEDVGLNREELRRRRWQTCEVLRALAGSSKPCRPPTPPCPESSPRFKP